MKASVDIDCGKKGKLLSHPYETGCLKTNSMHRSQLPALFLMLIVNSIRLSAQEASRQATSIGVFGGIIGYQGDLQPNSFSLRQVRFVSGLYIRQPLVGKFFAMSGFNMGKLHADDANNRDYLKIRNLNFYTDIREAFLAIGYTFLNSEQHRCTPFVQGGPVYFHYDPYTYDATGNKTWLQPLGTEGQGLSRYPDRQPYKLNQFALLLGGGLRIAASDAITVTLEARQRKTFTDYLDDVSKSYADRDALLAARGATAVALAFRSNELNPTATYPKEGEQRGTPTQMDWYYTAGISVEIKLNALTKLWGGKYLARRDVYYMKCPKVQ